MRYTLPYIARQRVGVNRKEARLTVLSMIKSNLPNERWRSAVRVMAFEWSLMKLKFPFPSLATSGNILMIASQMAAAEHTWWASMR